VFTDLHLVERLMKQTRPKHFLLISQSSAVEVQVGRVHTTRKLGKSYVLIELNVWINSNRMFTCAEWNNFNPPTRSASELARNQMSTHSRTKTTRVSRRIIKNGKIKSIWHDIKLVIVSIVSTIVLKHFFSSLLCLMNVGDKIFHGGIVPYDFQNRLHSDSEQNCRLQVYSYISDDYFFS